MSENIRKTDRGKSRRDINFAHVFYDYEDERGREIAESLDEAGYIVMSESVSTLEPEVVINRRSYKGMNEIAKLL